MLKTSLDSARLCRIPAALGDGVLVGKSRTGVWGFPTSLFPASDWEKRDQMCQEVGVAPGVGVRGGYVMCVWDGAAGSKGQPQWPNAVSSPAPTPTHSQSLKSRDVRASRNLRDHFVSERTRFIDEETEAQCFHALPNLAELFLFMYCHQGLVPALILHLAA